MKKAGLKFGIYPLSVAGTPFGLAEGPKDDYEKIKLALKDLSEKKKVVYPRNYLIYTKEWEEKMLEKAEIFEKNDLLADIVIGCGDWTKSEDSELEIEKWLNFIEKIIIKHGEVLKSVQITNEPNLSFMEGSKPYIMEALIKGVIRGKKIILNKGLDIKIGFGSVPESVVSVPDFWESIYKLGGKEFIEAIDFVGHNFYVDVFEERSLDVEEIDKIIEKTLRDLREKSFVKAKIPKEVAIRITENGWPTGENHMTKEERTEKQQGIRLEYIIKKVYSLKDELNISHYELFGLRDADSQKKDIFHQYGIMKDDYTKKQGYDVFKKMIQELGE